MSTKPDFSKVHPVVAREAVKNSDHRQAVYSQFIKLWFRQTHNLNVGFNNGDLQKWIDENCPEVFDAKGKKVVQ